MILLSAWDRSRDSKVKRNLSKHMWRTIMINNSFILIFRLLVPSHWKKKTFKREIANWQRKPKMLGSQVDSNPRCRVLKWQISSDLVLTLLLQLDLRWVPIIITLQSITAITETNLSSIRWWLPDIISQLVMEALQHFLELHPQEQQLQLLELKKWMFWKKTHFDNF